MKNKYIVFALLAFGSIFLIKDNIHANDGFGVSYDARHNLINCIVIENADQFNKDQIFLYFDYSKETGDRIGRPWTQIEKGKCYEYSTNREDTSSIALIKTDNTAFIDYLNTDAKKEFNSFDSIIWRGGVSSGIESLRGRFGGSLQILEGIEVENGNFRSTGLSRDININYLNEINMQSFKYIFGHGIVSFVSDGNSEDRLQIYLKENGKEQLSEKLFSTREDIINSFKQYSDEISSVYNSCLTNVKRVEYHENIKIYNDEEYGISSDMNSVGIYVLLRDNTFVKINSLRDLLNADCKQKVYNVHKKWIDIINMQGDVYYGTVQEIKKIQDNDVNFLFSEYYASYFLERNSIWSFEYMVTLNEKVVAPEDYDGGEILEQKSDIQPTQLDSEDISISQKIDNTFKSVNKNSNYLFYLYIILPLFAVLGILIYVKKRR